MTSKKEDVFIANPQHSSQGLSRRSFITGGSTLFASALLSKFTFGAHSVTNAFDRKSGASAQLTSHTFSTTRHTTHYWAAGPEDGPLIMFLHGWPQIGLMWRAQMEPLASEGWRCVAPDMRGYGGSSAPKATDAYAFKEIVGDMIELHDHLGAKSAIWVGHDLGSPIAGALAALHPDRCHGLVLVSIPYLPETFALPTLLPLVNRDLYPVDKYPYGEFDYFHFYLTHFDQTCSDFEADIPSTLAAIFLPGNAASVGKLYRSALITANGGWFGAAHRAPAVKPNPDIWPPSDFEVLVQAFRKTGFRPGNAWYLNDTANIRFVSNAPDGGNLRQPVLFVNGQWDSIGDIAQSHIGEPMHRSCSDLTITNLPSGHWLPLERKTELTDAIRSWAKTKALS